MESDKKPPTFNPNIPVVHSLNGFLLNHHGWIKSSGNSYVKNGVAITYDGWKWRQDGREIQFLEDIKTEESK